MLQPWNKPSHSFVHVRAAVRKECVPQVLLPEEEKIIVEEMKSNGQTIIEEKWAGCSFLHLCQWCDNDPVLLKITSSQKPVKKKNPALANDYWNEEWKKKCWCCLAVFSLLCFHFRSLVDAVYALKDEVHELKKVKVLSRDFCTCSSNTQYRSHGPLLNGASGLVYPMW